jgi:hypothetical protein
VGYDTLMKAMTWRCVGFLLGAMLASGLSTFGQDAPEKSPFLPEGYQVQAKPAGPPEPSPVARYELRSIMVLGGVHTFSLFDTTTSKGFWINLDETVEGVSISDYKKSDESVLVRSAGHERRLKLKEAQIVALLVTPPKPQTSAPESPQARRQVPSGPPTTIPGPPPDGVPSRAAINNLSDEEVRSRMQKVAEEIRRRRAMRRTMADEAAKQP